jgi:hypothetical protein
MRNTPDYPITLHVQTPVIAALSDFRAQARVQNVGNTPLRINAYIDGIPSLSLQIEDAQGRPVPHLPPPLPNPAVIDAGWQTLLPTAHASTAFQDLGVSESAMPPGSYRIRFRCRAELDGKPLELLSEWVELRRTPLAPL